MIDQVVKSKTYDKTQKNPYVDKKYTMIYSYHVCIHFFVWYSEWVSKDFVHGDSECVDIGGFGDNLTLEDAGIQPTKVQRLVGVHFVTRTFTGHT